MAARRRAKVVRKRAPRPACGRRRHTLGRKQSLSPPLLPSPPPCTPPHSTHTTRRERTARTGVVVLRANAMAVRKGEVGGNGGWGGKCPVLKFGCRATPSQPLALPATPLTARGGSQHECVGGWGGAGEADAADLGQKGAACRARGGGRPSVGRHVGRQAPSAGARHLDAGASSVSIATGKGDSPNGLVCVGKEVREGGW